MTKRAESDIPRLLSPEEVARIWGVDAKTVSRWADEGRLKSIRTPGGHRRFFAAEVLSSIKEAYASTEESDETEELTNR